MHGNIIRWLPGSDSMLFLLAYFLSTAGDLVDAVPKEKREMIINDIATVAMDFLLHDSLYVGSTSEVHALHFLNAYNMQR